MLPGNGETSCALRRPVSALRLSDEDAHVAGLAACCTGGSAVFTGGPTGCAQLEAGTTASGHARSDAGWHYPPRGPQHSLSIFAHAVADAPGSFPVGPGSDLGGGEALPMGGAKSPKSEPAFWLQGCLRHLALAQAGR